MVQAYIICLYKSRPYYFGSLTRITAELSVGTSLQNAKGIHCRRCDMRSSDLMGGELFIISLFLSFIADQQRAGLSASSARPMGGTDINYFFSFLI